MGRDVEAAAMESRFQEVQDAARQNRPKPEVAAGVYRMADGVTAPTLLYKTEPEYTPEARAGKIQGTTVLYAEIGTDGIAHNLKVQRSLEPGLDEKAMDAVGQWRFQPGIKDGAEVTVGATIEVNWKLQ
jgi:TonB family protein